jgi:hypothetical protein
MKGMHGREQGSPTMTRGSLLLLVPLVGAMFVAALSTHVSADATARYASVQGISATSGPTGRQRECTHPAFGFPTCYSLQSDGLWAREELTIDETGANWAVVGTATRAEVTSAVGCGEGRTARLSSGRGLPHQGMTSVDDRNGFAPFRTC